jgi:hypothetical protein
MTAKTIRERLLKTDTRGRVQTPAKGFAQGICGQRAQRAEVCRAGVRYSTFAHWVQWFREEGGEIAPIHRVPPAAQAEMPVR